MGHSNSKDNDEMIDKLVNERSLTSIRFEKAMRLVDRGRFIPEIKRERAYNDLPLKMTSEDEERWSPGPLHLSAPSIYANALEMLDIQEGMSFLNIGSGSGYFSTCVGFLLGENGINDGVEIHSNLVDYAEKINRDSIEIAQTHVFPWCRPRYHTCNALSMDFLITTNMYDRIYCGAAINEHLLIDLLLHKLAIGGKFVVPSNEHMMCYVRISPRRCVKIIGSDCQFSSLIVPNEDYKSPEIPSSEKVNTLRHLARSVVRNSLRKKCRQGKEPYVVSNIAHEEFRNNKRTNAFIRLGNAYETVSIYDEKENRIPFANLFDMTQKGGKPYIRRLSELRVRSRSERRLQRDSEDDDEQRRAANRDAELAKLLYFDVITVTEGFNFAENTRDRDDGRENQINNDDIITQIFNTFTVVDINPERRVKDGKFDIIRLTTETALEQLNSTQSFVLFDVDKMQYVTSQELYYRFQDLKNRVDAIQEGVEPTPSTSDQAPRVRDLRRRQRLQSELIVGPVEVEITQRNERGAEEDAEENDRIDVRPHIEVNFANFQENIRNFRAFFDRIRENLEDGRNILELNEFGAILSDDDIVDDEDATEMAEFEEMMLEEDEEHERSGNVDEGDDEQSHEEMAEDIAEEHDAEEESPRRRIDGDDETEPPAVQSRQSRVRRLSDSRNLENDASKRRRENENLLKTLRQVSEMSECIERFDRALQQLPTPRCIKNFIRDLTFSSF